MEPAEIPVTLTLDARTVARLEVLVDPREGLADLAAVLERLADHAQQGVFRPESWERGIVLQMFGYEWLDKMEHDPNGAYFDRPKLTTVEGDK